MTPPGKNFIKLLCCQSKWTYQLLQLFFEAQVFILSKILRYRVGHRLIYEKPDFKWENVDS